MKFRGQITVISRNENTGLAVTRKRMEDFALRVKTCCGEEMLRTWQNLLDSVDNKDEFVKDFCELNKKVDLREKFVFSTPEYRQFRKTFTEDIRNQFLTYLASWRDCKIFYQLKDPKQIVYYISSRYEKNLKEQIELYGEQLKETSHSGLEAWQELSDIEKMDRVMGNPKNPDGIFYTQEDAEGKGIDLDIINRAKAHLMNPEAEDGLKVEAGAE